jgi:hypothetical protein
LDKNGIVFGERPLDDSGGLMYRNDLTHALNIDLAHEEIFYTDSVGRLYESGYFDKAGVVIAPVADNTNLSNYQFGPTYQNVNVTDSILHPSGFAASDYSTLTHNCQLYANTVQSNLHLRMDI